MSKETRYRVPFEIGHKVTGKIVKTKGVCHWGHKESDEFEVNIHNSGGLCGTFYNAIYAYIAMLQMGAQFPKEWLVSNGGQMLDADTMLITCLDSNSPVTIQLHRSGPNRPPTVLD